MAGQFADEATVTRNVQRDPATLIGILEARLSQAQIDTLEPLISEVPGNQKEIQLLREMRKRLLEHNVERINPVVVEIERRIVSDLGGTVDP